MVEGRFYKVGWVCIGVGVRGKVILVARSLGGWYNKAIGGLVGIVG